MKSSIEIHENPPKDFQPKVEVAACYIEMNGRTLWLQRASKLEEGAWGVPGGKIEKNETPMDGAIRELKEETGISVKSSHLKSIGQLYMRKPDVDYVYHVFKVSLDSLPSVELSQEHKDYKWASMEDLGRMALMAGAIDALNYYYKRSKKRQGSIVSVYLLLKQNNQILLHLRKNTGYGDGKYGLVSGHVEDGEPATLAMVREAEEEAGITPKGLKPVHFLHRKTERQNLDIFFECASWDGKITNKEPEKCAALEFFPLEKLPSNTMEYIKAVLKAVSQGTLYSENGWEK